jgi:hypothetical protein
MLTRQRPKKQGGEECAQIKGPAGTERPGGGSTVRRTGKWPRELELSWQGEQEEEEAERQRAKPTAPLLNPF